MSKSGKGGLPPYPTAPPAYPSQPPPYTPQGNVPMPAQYLHPGGPGQQYNLGAQNYCCSDVYVQNAQPYGYLQSQPYGYAALPQGQPPPYGAPSYQGYPAQAQYPQMAGPRQTVVCTGLFDAGARFDGNAQPRIPPPPPGMMPNAAQLASMQGHTVVGTQRKTDVWGEGSGGGYTFW